MNGHRLSCEEVVRRLFAYLDAELDETANRWVDHHLETCRDCCSRLEFERRLRAKLLQSGSQEAPERLHRRIQRILDRF